MVGRLTLNRNAIVLLAIIHLLRKRWTSKHEQNCNLIYVRVGFSAYVQLFQRNLYGINYLLWLPLADYYISV